MNKFSLSFIKIKNSKLFFELVRAVLEHEITRRSIALHYFPSRRHRNDKLNMQQLILKKERIFERKVFDGDLDRRIQANIRENPQRFFSVSVL